MLVAIMAIEVKKGRKFKHNQDLKKQAKEAQSKAIEEAKPKMMEIQGPAPPSPIIPSELQQPPDLFPSH